MCRVLAATDENIRIAAKILRDGGLAAFPTETVYGLGANALDTDAVKSIFMAKGRPQDNPLIVHCANVAGILPLVKSFPEKAQRLADAFWPGPLTIILPGNGTVSPLISAGLDSVAVRIPSHPVALKLIAEAGVPVAAPSANRSGRPSPTAARHCAGDLDGLVDIILDGGDCAVGVESTVLTLTPDIPRILRPGGVTPCEIERIIGKVEIDDAVYCELAANENAASPGMKHRHYAPRAKVTLVDGDLNAFIAFCRENNSPNMWAMIFNDDLKRVKAASFTAISYGEEDNPEEQAKNLFAALRELDEKGAETVYIRAPKRDGIGLAVYNRLLRAAEFREVRI